MWGAPHAVGSVQYRTGTRGQCDAPKATGCAHQFPCPPTAGSAPTANAHSFFKTHFGGVWGVGSAGALRRDSVGQCEMGLHSWGGGGGSDQAEPRGG